MLKDKISGFVPISNAIAGKRLIKGTLTLEVPDKANGWVFDYESSKPYFEEWFKEINNATDGKSYGNIRLMHQLHVAGKIVEPPEFDDGNKLINITVQVTDDKSWQMVEDGTVCGFSFSGVKVPPTQNTLSKWASLPDGKQRYTGKPFEASLVDNNNQPGANWKIINNGVPAFEFEKEDGTKEERQFKIQNASFYSISSLAEALDDLQYTYVGDKDLQADFDKYVNGLIGVLQKMAKNAKSDHKDMTTQSDELEMDAKGDLKMDEKKVEEKKEVVAEPVMNAAAFKEMLTGAMTELKTSIVTEVMTEVKKEIANSATGVTALETQVKTLTDKLDKTPADNSVVSKDKDNVVVFNAAGSQTIGGLKTEDQADALTEINKVMNTVKRA